MSGILRRTLRTGVAVDNLMRISPWRKVITGIGVMFEPNFSVDCRDGVTDYDWSDQMNRIDDLEAYDPMMDRMGDNTCGGMVAPLGNVRSY